MAQNFQALLQASRDAIQESLESEASSERKQYKEIVDSKWFDKREDFFNARTQSLYIAGRGRLLEILEAFWTDALLSTQGRTPLHLPECAEVSSSLANRLPVAEILQRIEAVTRLREHLDMSGVNEALALEYGFVRAFTPESNAA
jgi:hypothetical protein